MPESTHRLIASYTLPSNTTSVFTAFTSIPQTYDDLLIKTDFKAATTGGWYDINMFINGDNAGFGYYSYGTGSGIGASTENNLNYRTTASASTAANIYGNTQIYIGNYAASGVRKAILADQSAENNSGAANSAICMITDQYTTNTNPITTIGFQAIGGANTIAGSSFWLYGIKNT
jgi:hypothetical protein